MAKPRRRDIERTYSQARFDAKLRRLTDALDAEAPFTIAGAAHF
jgi:hypothetical protein